MATSDTQRPSYQFVCALDFGTTFSGYAYRSLLRAEEISLNKEWGERLGISALKTPTTLLLTAKGDIEEFGFDADFKYMKLLESDDAKGLQWYRHFKMKLHKEKNISNDTTVESEKGHSIPALELFAKSISYLKDHFLDAVNRARNVILDTSDVLWVLTVPAIWSEKSKQFMRFAAMKGGLVDHQSSANLLLALEPEAASIYCQNLQLDSFKGGDQLQTQSQTMFKEGTKYLIIDAGGGTVDITAHQIQPTGELKELIPAIGGDWGGMEINRAFEMMLEASFGTKILTGFKKQHLSIWINMQADFEKKKRGTQPDGMTTISIDANAAFTEYVQENFGKQVKQILGTKEDGRDLYYQTGKMIVSPEGVLNLYHSNLEKIMTCLDEILKRPELEGLRYIYLVGGYAHSQYLYHSIQTEFNQHIVLVPEHCSTAIMRGAILFGLNPNRIVTRIARRTYGYSVRRRFEEGVHDPKKAVYDKNGDKYCKDIFRRFVSKGDEVKLGQKHRFHTCPFQADATYVTKRLFYTGSKDVEYVDEEGVERLAELRIKMDDIESGKEQDIKTTVTFTGTEMQVQCKVKNQPNVQVTVDFLSVKSDS